MKASRLSLKAAVARNFNNSQRGHSIESNVSVSSVRSRASLERYSHIEVLPSASLFSFSKPKGKLGSSASQDESGSEGPRLRSSQERNILSPRINYDTGPTKWKSKIPVKTKGIVGKPTDQAKAKQITKLQQVTRERRPSTESVLHTTDEEMRMNSRKSWQGKNLPEPINTSPVKINFTFKKKDSKRKNDAEPHSDTFTKETHMERSANANNRDAKRRRTYTKNPQIYTSSEDSGDDQSLIPARKKSRCALFNSVPESTSKSFQNLERNNITSKAKTKNSKQNRRARTESESTSPERSLYDEDSDFRLPTVHTGKKSDKLTKSKKGTGQITHSTVAASHWKPPSARKSYEPDSLVLITSSPEKPHRKTNSNGRVVSDRQSNTDIQEREGNTVKKVAKNIISKNLPRPGPASKTNKPAYVHEPDVLVNFSSDEDVGSQETQDHVAVESSGQHVERRPTITLEELANNVREQSSEEGSALLASEVGSTGVVAKQLCSQFADSKLACLVDEHYLQYQKLNNAPRHEFVQIPLNTPLVKSAFAKDITWSEIHPHTFYSTYFKNDKVQIGFLRLEGRSVKPFATNGDVTLVMAVVDGTVKLKSSRFSFNDSGVPYIASVELFPGSVAEVPPKSLWSIENWSDQEASLHITVS